MEINNNIHRKVLKANEQLKRIEAKEKELNYIIRKK